ncbi:MAG: AraC family transcriptional regulator [Bacteroidetes bacterium]|nr:AraC family transcriptional regulator [Bacteroidota bacterium]
MQIAPSIQLSGFVRHYLFLEGEGAALHRLRLFPDGNTGIVFNFSSPLTLDGQLLPDAFAYGQITEYKDIACHGRARLFVVVVRPDGFNRLLGLPAGELIDKVVSLADIFGEGVVSLQHGIADAGTANGSVALVEDFFGRLLAGCFFAANPLVEASMQLIQKSNGLLSVGQLAKGLGCHKRQLERQFMVAVGLSPKRFSNIVRTHAFLKHLPEGARLTGYAYDSGYYDQAHLIREFKQITGLTPSQYLKKTEPLAVNFLQMKG